MCKRCRAGCGALIWREKDIVQSVSKLLKITTLQIKSLQALVKMQATKVVVMTVIALKTGGYASTVGGNITSLRVTNAVHRFW